MSLTGRKRHGLVLVLAAIAAATIAACDTGPTQPKLHVAPTRQIHIQGDTTECTHGFVIINGWYQCM